MSGFVAKLTSMLTGGVVDSIADVADRFIETPEEKTAFKLKIQDLLQQREAQAQETIRAELEAKQRIIVAEMAQGDTYTKRARPTLIYFGMLVVFFNYCLVPLVQLLAEVKISPFALPVEFWLAWGGAVSVYSVGRSYEKRGYSNRLTQTITGTKTQSIFD